MTDKSESSLVVTSSSDLSMGSKPSLPDSFPIVGIGASAGGLEAFTQLLSNLEVDTGMGFVLIQHLSPQHHSQLSEILRNATTMPVNEAVEGMRIVPNSVYVIPPNTLMTLEQGVLRLEPRQRVRGKYMVIDGFFSSLAADRKHLAIAVILSGNNEDGTVGLGVVKGAGGVTFAQDLGSAEFPTMPMIAIASGYVDFVLPPAEIARELGKISQNAMEIDDSTDIMPNDNYEIEAAEASIFTESPENQKFLPLVLEILNNAMGVDFTHYKQGTIRRRIARRMGLLNLQNLGMYAHYLQEHPIEVEKLYHDILINVTSFFREPDSFKALKDIVFPQICQDKLPNAPIRIWVAGCATGEEVYSIAISLLEFFDDRPNKQTIQIFATDISTIAIEKARVGIYNHNTLIDISPERLRRFFVPVEGGYQIGKTVRSLCVFARQNLTNDPPFSRLDLISCRNMLIYLEPVLQRKVMPIFHYALNPNGFLMLGSSEGIGNATDLFAIADKKSRIYKCKHSAPRMNFNFVKSTYTKDSVSDSSAPIKFKEPPENNLELLADRVVLSRYAPVGVIVNSELDILQFRGQTSAYLEPAPGKASLNLLKMARPTLRLELRSAIFSAKDQDIPIVKDGIELQQGVIVKIEVIPLSMNNDPYFLVLFTSRPQRSLSPQQNLGRSRKELNQSDRSRSAELEVARLTHELEKTKEYLRSIIETQEANNQDLKVAGEEILSSNEELQSANEELETAKEEIQATNEELSTINDELRSRNVQLHQFNNDMQNLLSSVNIPILMLSGDLRIRRFTPMAEQSFNLIPSDVGRPFSDIQNNLDIPHIRTLITTVIDTLIPYEQEVKDLSGRWYSLRIRPYRTTDNHIDGVVISLIDIDLIKRNALELESSRNYAAAIIETLRQPLVVLNAEMQVLTANHAFYQIFQMSPSQTENQSIFTIGQGEWNIPKLRSLLTEILLLDITVQNYELTQNFPQLGNRTVLLNACQIDRPNIGQMILIAIEDITERNQQKLQLVIKNQELSTAMMLAETANLAKSEFMGSMSHELRTPLNSIMGFSQILRENINLDDESRQYLEIIYQSADYLLSLIEDILDISKIEAKKMAIALNPVALLEFLQVTVGMVSARAIAKNLTLTTQFAEDLPTTVYTDEKRLRQILLNLLSNAIKFTNHGRITLTINRVQRVQTSLTESPIELIQFTVTDTGIGIAANDLEKLFQPFEQVGTSKRNQQGAGLGLAISQNLVKQMGGEIRVSSTPDRGSTFNFALNLTEPPTERKTEYQISPAAPMLAIAPATDDITSSEVQIERERPVPVNKVKLASTLPLSILIAEDVQFNQILIQKFLQTLGYEPDTVNNGLDVLTQLRAKHYDVILMDIQMPEMDGIEVTKRIIAEWNQSSRPHIIAVTANASQEDRDKYLAAGMDSYISKPISFAQLEKALLQVSSHLRS
ncbi:CheR family methyltransferase [Pseudanabaena sp. UWO310]|uniref:CheR family methyltransferase n=1 Tax=Pseudanabaena sp. UWO310 TaxID=2480795 RepID=UPI00115BD0DC|nr:CheR family methyltransferase [Pseudanabaena sp. UWO310]TYQ27664.1 response regulator [Pseudanabaena sp. UWO310]